MPVYLYPWLSARREVFYDALHQFVHPDGYRLSDRVWRASQRTRNRIDALLAYHIRTGTSAIEIAKELEWYLQPGRKAIRTRRPYGRDGSYDAMRLARTEITAAHGRSTLGAAAANPFVRGVGWRLSGSHPAELSCNCEANSEADPEGWGPGVYRVEDVPAYPDHPH